MISAIHTRNEQCDQVSEAYCIYGWRYKLFVFIYKCVPSAIAVIQIRKENIINSVTRFIINEAKI